ncbi:MAG: tetratricopeptide repeat protein [candidate division WOR-3 bacterium]
MEKKFTEAMKLLESKDFIGAEKIFEEIVAEYREILKKGDKDYVIVNSPQEFADLCSRQSLSSLFSGAFAAEDRKLYNELERMKKEDPELAKEYEKIQQGLNLGSKSTRELAWLPSIFSDAQFYVGYCKFELGDIEGAILAINEAIKMNPTKGDYYNELGFLYGKSKDFTRSNFYYKKAIEKDYLKENKTIARSLRGLGFNLIEQGNLDEAEKMLKKSLELEPHNETALNELAYIKTLKDL